jgi:para-nitrobenzyl esterase
MPGDKLIELQKTLRPPAIDDPSFLWLAPTIDGWVVPKAPLDLPPPSLPLLIGNNGRELHLFGDLDSNIAKAFGANARKMRGVYSQVEADELADDMTFRCPAQVAARRNGGPAWLYEFNIGPNVKHAAEIPLVFGQGSQMQAYWINFARSGNPNGAGLPVWPRFDAKNGSYLDFTNDGPVAKANLRRIICQLLPRL